MSLAPPRPYAPGMGQRIGLFGGSFNPAHEGHMHVATTALERLNLDWVWWIVARGNPLKSDHGDFATCLASAKAIADHPRMRVLDIEARHELTYSIDTITRFQQRNQTTRFVWLMGGDNLEHFHKWPPHRRDRPPRREPKRHPVSNPLCKLSAHRRRG